MACNTITEANDALKLLQDGNERFVKMDLMHPNISKERREKLAKEGQHPFAIIVACSDSRVPLQLLFDRGIGDLFEIKTAGNLIDSHVIGSIEYGMTYLSIKLIVVVGHSSCNCIETALAKPKGESKYINSLLKSLEPAIALSDTQSGNKSYNVTVNNAMLNSGMLVEKNEVIRHYVEKKGVVIAPAYHDLQSGKVEFFMDRAISA